MGIKISEQTGLLISAALLGFALGGLYDAFRFLRVATHCGRVALFFLDIFYWLICAICVFIFFLVQNEGKLRFLAFLTGALGAAFYYNTLGVIFIKRAEKLDRKIKNQAKAAGRAVIKPVRRFGCAASYKMSKNSRFAYNFIKKEIKLLKIRLKVRTKVLYNSFKRFGSSEK